jgi:hypothetical protein
MENIGLCEIKRGIGGLQYFLPLGILILDKKGTLQWDRGSRLSA